jgi:hypothetical protein
MMLLASYSLLSSKACAPHNVMLVRGRKPADRGVDALVHRRRPSEGPDAAASG